MALAIGNPIAMTAHHEERDRDDDGALGNLRSGAREWRKRDAWLAVTCPARELCLQLLQALLRFDLRLLGLNLSLLLCLLGLALCLLRLTLGLLQLSLRLLQLALHLLRLLCCFTLPGLRSCGAGAAAALCATLMTPSAIYVVCMAVPCLTSFYVATKRQCFALRARSDMSRVTNRWPSAIRSTSIDIASMACSIRSSRAAVSNGSAGPEAFLSQRRTRPRTSGIPIDRMIAVRKNAIGTTISSSHTVTTLRRSSGERALRASQVGTRREQLGREALALGDSLDFHGYCVDLAPFVRGERRPVAATPVANRRVRCLRFGARSRERSGRRSR
jgi:hypothetical protein